MELTTPNDLSPRLKYKQAKKILKSTSRSKNPDWYSEALAINLQLHIFVGNDSGAISYIRNAREGSWSKGPNISPEMQADPTLLDEILQGIQSEHFPKSSKPSIGVILYVADEFSTAELGPDHQNPAEIEQLREQIIENPGQVLEDQSLSNDSHSWRLFPYPGAVGGNPFATAISLSRKHETLLDYLRQYGRDNDFPIQTCAVSAPLCTISALPWLLEQTPENGFVTVIHYPRFTVLAFFNTHGDLVLIRTLQHHGNAPFPPNTATAVKTTAISLEMKDPHVFILPMAGQPPMGMSGSISSIMPESQVIILSPTSSQLHIPTEPSAASGGDLLGMTRAWKWSDLTAKPKLETDDSPAEDPNSPIPNVTRPWKLQDMEAAAMLSQVRLEVVATTNPPSASNSPLANSHTFSILVQEMWPIQDFLPAPESESIIYPSNLEIKILKYSKFVKWGAVAAALALTGLSVTEIVKAKQSPAWGYTPGQAQFEMMAYNKKLTESKKVKSLGKDRSRAWSNMELLAKLFPDPDLVRIKKYNYFSSFEEDPDAKGELALSRTWNIKGIASNDSINTLNDLNTASRIKEIFNATSKVTSDQSFDTTLDSRFIGVDVKISQQSRRNPAYASMPVSFEMTINQTFMKGDELTLPKAKKK